MIFDKLLFLYYNFVQISLVEPQIGFSKDPEGCSGLICQAAPHVSANDLTLAGFGIKRISPILSCWQKCAFTKGECLIGVEMYQVTLN